MQDDVEIARPFMAFTLFARIEPTGEDETSWKWFFLSLAGWFIEHHVVHGHVGSILYVELDVINPFVLVQGATASVRSARFRHVHRQGLPRALGQLL